MIDLDGTLVDTAPDFAAALNAALADARLPAVDEEQVRGWIGHGTKALVLEAYCHATTTNPAQASNSPLFSKVLQGFEWHYVAQRLQDSRMYPGAVEGLRALRQTPSHKRYRYRRKD